MSSSILQYTIQNFFFFFFVTLVTGPRRSLSLKLSDTRVYEPQIRARLGTTTQAGADELVDIAVHDPEPL